MTEPSWICVWKEGIAPELPTEGLFALRVALEENSLAVIQGQTVWPCAWGPYRPEAGHKRVEEDGPHLEVWGACVVGYCLMQAHGLTTKGQVSEAFERLNERVFARLKFGLMSPGAFYHEYDRILREEMRLVMRKLIDEELQKRATTIAA